MKNGRSFCRYGGPSFNAFPFNAGTNAKALREWTRGLGPVTNTKGTHQHAADKLNPPSNVAAPATTNDYRCIDECLSLLRGGMLTHPSQFLYCSILVPHPPYATNATYLEAVKSLEVHPVKQVPLDQLHPNDVATATLKGTLDLDTVSVAELERFRRIYFSMCYEADSFLGQLIEALNKSGARQSTYVLMISDHSEDNTEHRQLGKNNMYDSGSRVAMMLSGPGIAPNQVLGVDKIASLNDVYPTVVDMAGLSIPTGLAGSSLLPLVNGKGDPARKDFITAQYHSVFSVTGEFMIRQGDYKMIKYGKNQFGGVWPPQLFHMKEVRVCLTCSSSLLLVYVMLDACVARCF